MSRISKYSFLLGVLCSVLTGVAQAQEVEVIGFEELDSLIKIDAEEVKVVNFWATWCKPCIEEMPAFETISKDYRLKDVKVLLVSLDFAKDLERVGNFVKRRELSSEVVLLNEPDYDSWINKINEDWSGAIPATLIISKAETKFLEQKMDEAELRSTIDKLLN
ncbi:TlpA disulfide reductase family protein [Jiulongibacter sp. NS-SX5]|uniref:TlpA disulfide reductase family protein n=1 Tax=Jiulongibacter sp. NS-SX5 TaxID=3463854 RepID=UPI0040583EF4